MTTTEPTIDLAEAKTRLDDDGYCVIPDALPATQVAALRERLVAVAALERESGKETVGPEGPDNQRVWGLLDKGSEFVDLVQHPLALSLISHLLGPEFLLSSITANIAGPGGPPMFLHTDQGYILPPWPPYPFVANVMWMLDDFTEANGATRLVPRSHRDDTSGFPDQSRANETIPMVGRAGSAVCFDGRILHQTGANVTPTERRHGILTYYCRPWIRQQENFSLSLRPETWTTLPPLVKDLVGLKIHGTLGMVDGPTQRGFRYG